MKSVAQTPNSTAVRRLFCVFSKVQKKNLHITGKSCIITHVVTLIAVKREVAAGHAGVPWSECQVRKTGDKSLYNVEPSVRNRDDVCVERRGHTREDVQSPLVVLNVKVRKGGDFFYGKSSNENYVKSV